MSIDAHQFIRAVRLKRDSVPSFDVYPFALPAIRGLTRLPFDTSVTMLVGENGSGKSTLLEAIGVAWGFNPEGGSINFRFRTRESHSSLAAHMVLERSVQKPRDGFFLRAESFYNVATEIERLDAAGGFGRPVIDSYGGRSLHEQSHGEAFLTLAMQRFGGRGLYILDEPEAALSPSRQLALIVRIHDLVKMGCQFIIATHSPILLAYPGASLFSLEAEGISAIRYEDTEHYTVTRRFLMDHTHALNNLLEDVE